MAPAGAKRRLREAVDAYLVAHGTHLDQHARALLERLADDFTAANVFVGLELDYRRASLFLVGCIEAENLARTYHRRIRRAKAILARETQLRGRLKRFADLYLRNAELDCSSFDPLSMQGRSALLGEADVNDRPIVDEMTEANRVLCWLKDSIRVRSTCAQQDIRRFLVTHKSGIKLAGQNAAIGWLAARVDRLTGRAHQEEVAQLAGVILGVTVSLSRIRDARKRLRRQ